MPERRVVVLGFFDGVHRGHRALLEVAHRFATHGGPCRVVVVTFDTVPKIRADLLCSPEDRVRLLRDAGADQVRLLRFDDVRCLRPGAFLDRCVSPLRPLAVAVGEEFRFGYGGMGGIPELRRWCARRHCALLVVGEVRARAADGLHRVSASRIRKLVAAGRFADASALLGRPYEIGGAVVPGRGIGRTLGVPTFNWTPALNVLHPTGVMAGWLVTDGTLLPAVAYVGTRPTFEGTCLVGEVHVIGRPPTTLERIIFRPVALLRRDQRFSSATALQHRMRRDVARARAILGRVAAGTGHSSKREAAPCR